MVVMLWDGLPAAELRQHNEPQRHRPRQRCRVSLGEPGGTQPLNRVRRHLTGQREPSTTYHEDVVGVRDLPAGPEQLAQVVELRREADA